MRPDAGRKTSYYRGRATGYHTGPACRGGAGMEKAASVAQGSCQWYIFQREQFYHRVKDRR